jgi:hypothetical protein
MKKINVRKKGSNGEREFCNWLKENFNLKEKPKRNLEQVRSGGYDILFKPFIFEIKRTQTIDRKSWWSQVNKAKKETNIKHIIPVVAYRMNHKKWKFLINAKYLKAVKMKCWYIELEDEVFIDWAKQVIKVYSKMKT